MSETQLLYPWVLLASALLAYLVLARPDLFMLVLIAILPWQGALRFPTHSVTIVKLVGGLLFVAVLLTTLLRDRKLRFTPAMAWAGLLCLLATLSLLASGLSAFISPAIAADVTAERLINADKEPHNWLMNHRTYDGQRFSPLARIDRKSVV